MLQHYFLFICFHFLLSFSSLHLKIVWNSQEGCTCGAESLYLRSPPSLTQCQQLRWPGQLPPRWPAPLVFFPVISMFAPPPHSSCVKPLIPVPQPQKVEPLGGCYDWKRMEFHGRIMLMDSRELVTPVLCEDSGSMCQPQARMGVFDRHPLSKCDLRLDL